jgi:hypothetical protein
MLPDTEFVRILKSVPKEFMKKVEKMKEEPPKKKEKYILIANQTPKRIKIILSEKHQLLLPPLDSKYEWITDKEEEKLKPYRDHNLIIFEKEDDPRNLKDLAYYIILVLVTYFLASIYIYFSWGLPSLYLIASLPVLLILIGFASFLVLEGWTWFKRASQQFFSLFMVLLIGVGLPAAVIYYYCGGEELIANETPELLGTQLGDAELDLTQLGHLLQFIFIVIVSLLPALLFYLYDRERLGTLHEDFLRQIFRFDPNMDSMSDVKAKYGKKIEELYGSEPRKNKGRFLGGSRIPLLLATLMITIGWLLVLLPAGMDKAITDPNELHLFFIPQKTAFVFAFLGAYLFTISMLLRRYARGDLRPKAYTHVAVRVIIVIILAWVLELYMTESTEYLLVIAFFVGIFPEEGLTFIKESFVSRGGGWSSVFPSLEERHPLTNLEGVDLYDRNRLWEEGVTNIESLAHHDVIDLMLDTRIPVPRLVDWVDQAILYLHVVPDIKGASEKVKNEGALLILQRHGIRTATDLLAAAFAAKNRKENGANSQDEFNKFLNILEGHDTTKQPPKLRVLIDAILDDEWLEYIWHWRQASNIEGESFDLNLKDGKLKSISKGKVEERMPRSFYKLAIELYSMKKPTKKLEIHDAQLKEFIYLKKE